MEQQQTYLNDVLNSTLPLFSALGDSQRQTILLLLNDGTKRSVAELTMHTSLSRPTVSHHLKLLKDVGLLSEERQGTKRYYYPTFQTSISQLKSCIEALEATVR